MKTIIHFFILLMITFSLTGCPDYEPIALVDIGINNSTADTLNLYYRYYPYADDDSWIDTITLHSLPFSTNYFHKTGFAEKYIKNDVFGMVIKNLITGKQLIIIEELSGDTLANWNDSSAVFTDQQYWTITPPSDKYAVFKFTLNLTEEVLKLE